jgi:hypothetical protein
MYNGLVWQETGIKCAEKLEKKVTHMTVLNKIILKIRQVFRLFFISSSELNFVGKNIRKTKNQITIALIT